MLTAAQRAPTSRPASSPSSTIPVPRRTPATAPVAQKYGGGSAAAELGTYTGSLPQQGSGCGPTTRMMPRQARVLRGWTGDPLCMMAGLERGAFGGVLFTGYHAWGCCGGNPLSHTMTTACDQVTLNGVPASEFLINESCNAIAVGMIQTRFVTS